MMEREGKDSMRVWLFRPTILVSALAAAIAAGIAAIAQVAPGAVGASMFQVRPFQQPAVLRLASVPSFQFAAEVTSMGAQPAGMAPFIAIEGAGSVLASRGMTVWKLEFNRVVVGDNSLSGTAPLAILTVETDPKAPDNSSYALGFAPPQVLPPGSPAHRVLDNATRALIAGLGDPSSQPLSVGSPMIDLSEGLRRYLKRYMPAIEIVDPINPVAAEGVAFHQGRYGVAGRARDALQLRYGPQSVPLNADATMLFDADTALPLLSDIRLFGNVSVPSVNGPVDYRVRVFVSLPGMRNPGEFLQPPPQRMPAAALPAPGSQAQPPPVQRPAAAPAPQAPQAPTPPRPAGQKLQQDELEQQLLRLKNLHERGLISKEQYEARQKAILDRM